jgi:hypothetical protein
MKIFLAFGAALVLAFFGIARHNTPLLAGALALAAIASGLLWLQLRELRRAEFIRTYTFPPGLFDKLAARRPELERKDMSLVARALRQYFLAYLKSGRKYVSMPSQVVDDLWHEFILYTKNYQQFCEKAFGTFFHHTPAAVLTSTQSSSNTGLRRTWWYACKEENINPRKPVRLPLLFALDSKLAIAGGFLYAADCAALRAGGRGDLYCGGDFSDSSFDGSTSGFGDSDSDSSGSHGGHGGGDSGGSDSGGDSGGSCGGGGCGGGGGD